MNESCALAKKRKMRACAWSGKSQLHEEERRRGKASKENLPRRSGKRMSRWVAAKSLQKDQGSLGFTSNLAKPQIGNEVEGRSARL